MRDPELIAYEMRERAQKSQEPLVVYETLYKPSEDDKKLFFNAGRWAGGHRDWTARQAFEKLRERGEF